MHVMGSPPARVVKAKNRVPLVPQNTLRHIGFSAVPFPFIDGNVMSGKDCAEQSVLCDRGRGSSSKHRRQPDFAATARRPSYSKNEVAHRLSSVNPKNILEHYAPSTAPAI